MSLGEKYVRIKSASPGMDLFSVSTLDLRNEHLAFYHDEDEYAGRWGIIDESLEEVIAPKYLFPLRFRYNGKKYVSVVARGEWYYSDTNWKDIHDNLVPGWWTDEELYGVIDEDEQEIIPLKYAEIQEIVDDYREGVFRGYAVWQGTGQERKMGLFNTRGEQLTDFIFKDCDYYDSSNGYLVVGDGEMYYDKDIECNVYDFENKKLLFPKGYKFIEIVDGKNGLFYVSDDVENGYNGQLINIYNERVGEKFLKDTPSNLGLSLPGASISESLPDKTYRGTMLDGRECYFKVNGTDIDIERIFTEVYISKERFAGEDIAIAVDGELWCLAIDYDETKNTLGRNTTIDYDYLRQYNLNNLPTPVEEEKYGEKMHKIFGRVYKIVALYGAQEGDAAGRTGYGKVVEKISDAPIRLSDDSIYKLLGWDVVLCDTVVGDGVKYGKGCDGMWMTFISIDDCAIDGSRIVDLGNGAINITGIFNYIDFNMRPDMNSRNKECIDAALAEFNKCLPYLSRVDYYGHTILPPNGASEDFLKVEEHAHEHHNKKIEKLAHDVYSMFSNAYREFRDAHCLFVRFDGM